MSKSRRAGLLLVPIMAIGVACGTASGPGSETTEQPSSATRVLLRGVMPLRTSNAAAPAAAGTCPAPITGSCPPPPPLDGGKVPPPHLDYYGGRIISQARIVQVLWADGGSFYPPVTGGTGAPSLPDFYAQLTRHGIDDWLSEYDTPTQSVQRATFVGTYSIAPSPPLNTTTITDDEIQTELRAALDSGAVPKRGYSDPFDYVYLINFPQGRSLVASDGSLSCVNNGFCGYHWTFDYLGTNIYYAVLPDLTSQTNLCSSGCGPADPLGNQTGVASHELAEMITDAQVGYADLSAPPGLPLAWFDPYFAEIGDLCNQVDWPLLTYPSLSYQVQTLWSNAHNACFTTSACVDPNACNGRCGTVTDACGVQVECGGCVSPQTCGGGGVANVCGCTPNPNPCGARQCGVSMPDGCGGFVACHANCSIDGLCPCHGGQCSAGACVCYKGPCL